MQEVPWAVISQGVFIQLKTYCSCQDPRREGATAWQGLERIPGLENMLDHGAVEQKAPKYTTTPN